MKWADVHRSIKKTTETWVVYLLECNDGSYYCGITNNLDRRIQEHNSGSGAKYTRGRTPVKLLTSSEAKDRSAALKLESAVKKQRKNKKVQFLSGHRNIE